MGITTPAPTHPHTSRNPATMFRHTLARNARLFSTSIRVQKGPVEAAQDGLKAVDRTVSETIVKGIEKGEEASAKAKEVAGIGKKEAKDAAAQAELKGGRQLRRLNKLLNRKVGHWGTGAVES